MTIPAHPALTPLSIEMRDALSPLLFASKSGISEYSFANLYLFRNKYRYALTENGGHHAIHGYEDDIPFWIFPQGLPDPERVRHMCPRDDHMIKCIAESDREKAHHCAERLGYTLMENRSDFDYLYRRSDLAELGGRKFHKKRNLINNFKQNYEHELRPLSAKEVPHAHRILDSWHAHHQTDNDYHAAKEALEHMGALGLCGYIAYAEGHPAAFAIGEGMARHRIYVIHFEKGVAQYKGAYQYINMAYSALLPRHYEYINREQDMGDEGLRQAKMTYRPADFVRKIRLVPPSMADRFPASSSSVT